MSCHPASTWARYVAGELSREESRSVESHLVQCRRCRELVLSLREPWDVPPDATSRYAINRTNPNFFVIEEEQVDIATVFHTESVADNTGTLTTV